MQPEPDLTLLGIIFGVNVGFSAIDSLAGNLLEALRKCTGKRLAKYRDAKWIKNIAPTDTVKDETKRILLSNVISKVLAFAEQTDNLFRTNVFYWKIVMAMAAAAAFVFMAIPYVRWWSSLLILPIPLCFCSCLIELILFQRSLGKKCNEVEMIYNNLKEDNAIPSNQTDMGSVETRLSAIEEFLGKK